VGIGLSLSECCRSDDPSIAIWAGRGGPVMFLEALDQIKVSNDELDGPVRRKRERIADYILGSHCPNAMRHFEHTEWGAS